MSEQRQQAFLKLKPPCVNLSSVALKFRTKEVPVKDVLRALEIVKIVLNELAEQNQLDAKLAEYAFFPLAQQVFNEAQRLSPRCLEVAVDSVTLLVSYGYRQSLQPELGKQLIILMSMLAGAGPSKNNESATDELRVATFRSIAAIIKALSLSVDGAGVFEDQGTRNVVDQLVYLLLESITDSPSDHVQLAASDATKQLVLAIKSRVFLASLLPRTVSALTKALKPSTKARRTQKILTAHLSVFRCILSRTLCDRIATNPTNSAEKDVLGESWLKATSSQLRNALIQVVKLRNHTTSAVRRALEELCVNVIEDCQDTLVDSVPIVLETLVVLSAHPDGGSARSTCRHLIIAYPVMSEILRSSFSQWSISLPRLMQGHDEQLKLSGLQKLTASLRVLDESDAASLVLSDHFISTLVSGISQELQNSLSKPIELQESSNSSLDILIRREPVSQQDFEPILLNHESQRKITTQLLQLVHQIQQSKDQAKITQYLINSVAEADGAEKLASLWLALQVLRQGDSGFLTMDDLFIDEINQDSLLSRNALLGELCSTTLLLLGSVFEDLPDEKYGWQLQALAMESIVMYAQTFSADTYRSELMDTLYPVLSFFGSPNTILRSHAITALDKLALTCQYSSTTDLLIKNVDYLVNSVAWKLNTYSLSPEAPQILRMLIHLCGAELIPYLDDLIQSVFAALDSYHGYPEWVETLFEALKAMVDVSVKQPQLAITQGKSEPAHKKSTIAHSSANGILEDIRSRKRRRLDFDRPAEEPPTHAPQRPWTDSLDGPSFPKPPDEPAQDSEIAEDEYDKLAPMKPSTDEAEEDDKKLSKSHNLLLSIATATVPHLASPSPRVRHLLLDLLKDISPLLSRDENSFLPLINAIWPVVVPRLFADQTKTVDSNGASSDETAYNICAAADTIAMLCVNAGDFMTSRIEDIFAQLTRLFRTTKAQVNLTSTSSNAVVNDNESRRSKATPPTLTGSVTLQVVKPLDQPDSNSTPDPNPTPTSIQHSSCLRTTSSTLLTSLTTLILTILSRVTLTLDTGDEILRLLLPLMIYRVDIRGVLEEYNADAVWLFDLTQTQKVGEGGNDERQMRSKRQRERGDTESGKVGIHEMEDKETGRVKAVLRPELIAAGFKLVDV